MKKLFALILAVLMVASLVACAPAEPQTTTAPKATQPAGTQPAGTTAAPTTTEAPFDPASLPWVEPGSVKITFGINQNATVVDYDNNYLTKHLEEQTGLDIEFVFFSSDAAEARQQLNLMVAGKEKLPDIIAGFLDGAMVRELGAEGWLYDLAPLYEQNLHYHSKIRLDAASDSEKALYWCTIRNADGSIYSFPSMTGTGTIDSCVVAGALNRTWAEKFGMKVEDIDTVKELYDYLTKCVNEDPNGNGQKDEMGLVGSQKSDMNNYEQYVLNAYVYLNDKFLWNVTDGEIWSPYVTDEYREGIIELNKWYKEGLISPLNYSISNNAEIKAMVETPELYKVAGFFGHPTLVCNSGSEIGLEYQGYSALQDETGLGGYWPRLASVKITTTTAISATCEHPELAFALLDFIAGEPYTIRVKRYGEEGVNWERLDPEVVKKENLVASNGLPAGMKIIKDEWSEETTKTWHTGLLNCEIEGVAGIVPGFINGTASTSNPKARGAISTRCYQNALATGEPAETFKNPVYNADEQEVVDTYETAFKNFVKESRAKFITGALDPSDDAQWNAYLKELEQNGLEDLMEVAQEVYTRMNG